jgi:hypothetical protein
LRTFEEVDENEASRALHRRWGVHLEKIGGFSHGDLSERFKSGDGENIENRTRISPKEMERTLGFHPASPEKWADHGM